VPEHSCLVQGCNEKRYAKGYCRPHYRRLYKYGTLQPEPEGCSVEGCGRSHYSKGYCRSHHFRWREHGDPLQKPLCRIETCRRKVLARDLCKPHYRYLMAHGEPVPAALLSELSDLDRFRTFVSVEPNGCWRWTGHTIYGYGQFHVANHQRRAHRFAYEAFVGEIPEGLHIDHFRFPQDGCIGPSCVNPEHLRPATAWENTLRSSAPSAMNKAKEFCKWGHEYTPENTYQRPEGRRCRQCRIDQKRARRARLRS